MHMFSVSLSLSLSLLDLSLIRSKDGGGVGKGDLKEYYEIHTEREGWLKRALWNAEREGGRAVWPPLG